MDKAEISDVILPTDVDDHELCFPKFLVVWDLIVIGLTFSDLENTSITLESDFHILELFGVDALKFELKSFFRNRIWSKNHFGLLQETWVVKVFAGHILEGQVSENLVIFEVLKSWVGVVNVGSPKGILVGINGTLEVGLIKLELMLK